MRTFKVLIGLILLSLSAQAQFIRELGTYGLDGIEETRVIHLVCASMYSHLMNLALAVTGREASAGRESDAKIAAEAVDYFLTQLQAHETIAKGYGFTSRELEQSSDQLAVLAAAGTGLLPYDQSYNFTTTYCMPAIGAVLREIEK